MSISLKEVLGDNNWDDLKLETQLNMQTLVSILNEFREAYGKPLIVTSGLRSMSQHLEIYKKKGITDKAKIPMNSNHLKGLAVDFADPDGKLKEFIKSNIELIKDLNLYFEDFSATPTWVHVQIVPPASGKRFFKP